MSTIEKGRYYITMKLKLGLILYFIINPFAYSSSVLKVGVIEYAPIIKYNKKDNSFSGPLIEHVKKTLGKDYKLSFIKVPIYRIPELFLSKNIDLVLLMSQTKARKNLYSFSRKPTVIVQPKICTQKDNNKALSASDKIIVPRSDSWRSWAKPYSKNLVELSYSGGYVGRALKMLSFKRAQFAVFPDLSDKNLPENVKCYFDESLSWVRPHLAFPKGSVHKSRVDKLWKSYSGIR